MHINSLATMPSLQAAVVTEAAHATTQFENPDQPTISTGTASKTNMREALQQLQAVRLPIGYNDAPTFGTADWWRWLLFKVPGLLVTTFAVSLGAPFWFDVLQKASNLWAAGTPPRKAEDEDRVAGGRKA